MSWKGVKKQSLEQDVKFWCDEMGIKNYTINSQGEIDVDGSVNLRNKDFKELPYKFGEVTGFFDIGNNPNLISLKNCPDYTKAFSCSQCSKLDSLKWCPKRIGSDFYCYDCKKKFTEEEVKSLCKVGFDIYN